jgi:hypothetical protein
MLRCACLTPAAIGVLLLSTIPAKAEQTAADQAAATSPMPLAANGAAIEPGRLDDEELANFRGGQAITVANQTMTSVVADASIGGDVSAGAVNLSDNALSSFNGLGNVVINTGSQVSVQSGMNVTINVHQ